MKRKYEGGEERSKIIICGETQSKAAGGILHLPTSGTLQKGTYGSLKLFPYFVTVHNNKSLREACITEGKDTHLIKGIHTMNINEQGH